MSERLLEFCYFYPDYPDVYIAFACISIFYNLVPEMNLQTQTNQLYSSFEQVKSIIRRLNESFSGAYSKMVTKWNTM